MATPDDAAPPPIVGKVRAGVPTGRELPALPTMAAVQSSTSAWASRPGCGVADSAAPIAEVVKHVCERRLAPNCDDWWVPHAGVFALAHQEVPRGAQRALTLTVMIES